MKSLNEQLPIELRELVHRKVLFRVLSCLFLIAVNATIILLWGDVLFATAKGQEIFKHLCYELFLLLPLVITRIDKVFTDRSYIGTVQDVRIATVADSKSAVKPTREMLYCKNEIFLAVKTDSGKIIERKVYSGPANNSQKLEYYHVGDRVLHLHGTGVTIVLPEANSKRCYCAVCEGSSDIRNRKCEHCGRVLMK